MNTEISKCIMNGKLTQMSDNSAVQWPSQLGAFPVLGYIVDSYTINRKQTMIASKKIHSNARKIN